MILHDLIGESAQFRNVIDEIRMVAPMDCTVLIQGETGTGKEVIARAIHDGSSRRNGPFVAVNCAAIPNALLESELFGHEKGAFTGAISRTTGKFLAAHGGTFFLDEIGDLPLELQPKLLRVLQEHQIERLGSTRTTRVDIRILAATNLCLLQMVEEKRFRADLCYRLNVFPLRLPPLRERGRDAVVLAEYFVQKFAKRMGKVIEQIPDEVIEFITRHHWPGNIRELQNFIERSVIMTTGNTLSPRLTDLESFSLVAPAMNSTQTNLPEKLEDIQRAHITFVLKKTNGVVGGKDGAAARLGLPRTTLISHMIRLGIRKI